MNFDELKTLVSKGESDTLEFKKSTAKLHAAFETVCAFLNGNGGTVLIGVTDNRKIVGQQVSDSTKRDIASKIAQIEPAAQPSIEYVDITPELQVIAIKVNPGEHAPYDYDGRSFQRTQSSTERMSQHRYEQKIIERGQLNHSWEDAVDNTSSIDELDNEEIHQAIMEGISEKRIPASIAKENTDKILRQLELTVNGKPKRAAIALFGKTIRSEYSQCWLKLARFKGTDKLGEFIDNQQFHCNLFKILEEADNFLRRHLPIASHFKPGQLRRIDTSALPMLAVREALVNAVCHRDYSSRSGYISIAIFDDRVEIWNNGTLPNELKLSDLKRKHDSVLRNNLIAKIFYLRGFIEAWGTGTTKILQLCKDEGLPVPTFSERTGGFLVTFKLATPMGGEVAQKERVSIDSLSPRQQEILRLLEEKGMLSAIQITDSLQGTTRLRTIQADLLELKNQGVLEQSGKGKSSVWKIRS